MDFIIDKIFLPSVGVDLVFNMSSLTPYARSSIIFDVDYGSKTILIAQPLIPFSSNTTFNELHLTTIFQEKSRKIRLGVKCSQFKLIDQFPLANNTIVPAVLLTYALPVKETNIRSAFRLPLSTKYIITGKIFYGNLEYQTARDFSIRDISLTGLGIIIPKKRNKNFNPLTEITINEEITMGIIVVDMNQNKPVGTLTIKVQVTRINPNYSENHTLVGLKITNLNSSDESILNKFIHAAQIEELKKMSGRNL